MLFESKMGFFCVFLTDLCFSNDLSQKKPECAVGPKALSLFTLACQKVNEVATAKQGIVGCGLVGADRANNTSITHCQILPSIPTPLIHAEVSAQDLWADDIQLCRCNVTTLIYKNKQFFSTTREADMHSTGWKWVWYCHLGQHLTKHSFNHRDFSLG